MKQLKISLSLAAVLLTLPAFSQTKSEVPTARHRAPKNIPYLKLDLKKDEKIGNVFSRTISIRGDSFAEIVYRFGGTGVYTVADPNPDKPVFSGVFRYDGNPESTSRIAVSENGKVFAYDGKPGTNTDGSGVMFNSFIWGTPPQLLQAGTTWSTTIVQPWELGGPGLQTVTVVETDPVNHTIRLKREGNGSGYFDNDLRQVMVKTSEGKIIKMDLIPGEAHWTGFTTFKNGLVISDELVVVRPVTLTAENLKFTASQREYILLNAMPVNG